jgi:hypothetical protein
VAPIFTRIGFCQSVISRSSPILISRSSGGAALVDARGEVAHVGDPVGDLVAHQHPATARLRPLADDHLDGVGAAQVIGVHPVARGKQLTDELL